jgi:plasmid stabilization system protein ParE
VTIRVSLAASADLERVIDWLTERSPRAGREARDQLLGALDLLDRNPYAAPAVELDAREKVVSYGRDGFIVRYRVESDAVVILRVLHGRQQR